MSDDATQLGRKLRDVIGEMRLCGALTKDSQVHHWANRLGAIEDELSPKLESPVSAIDRWNRERLERDRQAAEESMAIDAARDAKAWAAEGGKDG